MSYITRAGVEEMSDNSWIDEILEPLHEHGKRCYCDDEEKGLTREDVKAAIQAHIEQVVTRQRPVFLKHGFDLDGQYALAVRAQLRKEILEEFGITPQDKTGSKEVFEQDKNERV